MSRAFVRESDDRPELPLARQAAALPAGARNYITPDGAARLREELRRLVEIERPRFSATDDPEAKRQLLVLAQRIQQLEASLQAAEVVPLPEGAADVVRFGASVTIRRATGDEDEYRIVGIDEIDLDRGWVSWASPIARALLNARAGERVRFKFPSGEEQIEVVSVRYDVQN
ncbi:MAG: GreA/GreB family elongation factor [Verrucomicrobiota bacterium]|nr:GreA/GreB family elongation factor [Verrucomicrobiota bacterium]